MNMNKSNAFENLLRENDYPGRGIMIGQTKNGSQAVFCYFIMGRSPNSRNRIFKETGDDVMIKPYDETKVEDPSLIIYYPVRKYGDKWIVTNGDQTDTIVNFLENDKTFEDALLTRKFEPDSPNWTPRISSIINLNTDPVFNIGFTYKMSILKCLDDEGKRCGRFFYDYESIRGKGHFIHTYEADGNPLPTFIGEPETVEIGDDIEEFGNSVWKALNSDNKISMHISYIDLATNERKSLTFNKNLEG